jgi:uncharacterized membrane protein
MNAAWEYLAYLAKWHGSFLLPLVVFAALAVRGCWTPRPSWLVGAIVAGLCYATTFTFVFVHDLTSWMPSPNSWVQVRPTQIFQLYSALPIQTILHAIFGNDSFAERRLLNFDAFAVWTLLGALLGISVRFRIHKFKNEA